MKFTEANEKMANFLGGELSLLLFVFRQPCAWRYQAPSVLIDAVRRFIYQDLQLIWDGNLPICYSDFSFPNEISNPVPCGTKRHHYSIDLTFPPLRNPSNGKQGKRRRWSLGQRLSSGKLIDAVRRFIHHDLQLIWDWNPPICFSDSSFPNEIGFVSRSPSPLFVWSKNASLLWNSLDHGCLCNHCRVQSFSFKSAAASSFLDRTRLAEFLKRKRTGIPPPVKDVAG